MRKQTKQWTVRDGTKIRICDMGDQHLINTIRMCMRIGHARHIQEINAFYACPAPTADMASYYWDQACGELDLQTWEDYVPDIFSNICDDADRRNLTYPTELVDAFPKKRSLNNAS